MADILISGASIAGPALAYWLRRHGHTPTVVERAPVLRAGGQAIDVRGTAIHVVERMGLLDQVREARTRTLGVSFVDSDGIELHRSTERTLTGGAVDSQDIELLRSDLGQILYDATRDDVEYVFCDSISEISQHADGVSVTFESGVAREFDFVVGADGLHSNVRALAFGPEERFIKHMNTYLAVFSVDNFLGLDRWQVFHQSPGKMSGVYTTRTNSDVRAVMGFESSPIEYDHRDVDQHRKLVADAFAGDGWEVPRLIEAMWEAPDLYFDSMGQIHMDSWSSGRVALVGDAAYCASPLSGQGTSMALVGAYILAGELSAGSFGRYDELMREYVRQNQQMALYASEKKEMVPPEVLERASNVVTLPDYPLMGGQGVISGSPISCSTETHCVRPTARRQRAVETFSRITS